MVILHVGRITDNKMNGVNVVVPQHVESQAKFAKVALVNFLNIKVVEDNLQLEYNGAKNFPNYLKAPFDKPDLVVIHGSNNIDNIKIYNNLIRRNIPYIIVPHGELTKAALSKKWLKKKLAYVLLFDRFVKHALALQCLSQGEMDSTRKGKKKFIGTNGIFDNPNKKQTFARDGMQLVYVGRLDALHKGLDLLVCAMAKNREFLSSNKIALSIYGPDGGNRKEILLGIIADNAMQDFIKIYPPIFGEEKAQIIRESDVFIQTSRFEGMPVGILEVMNIGLPCIVSEGTTLREMVDGANAGYGCDGDIDSIGEAIKSAYYDRDNWEVKSANAIRLTQSTFEWSKIAATTLEHYQELLADIK